MLGVKANGSRRSIRSITDVSKPSNIILDYHCEADRWFKLQLPKPSDPSLGGVA